MFLICLHTTVFLDCCDFTNWGFHKLMGREGKLVKVGLLTANGSSVLELENLDKPPVAQGPN